MRDVEMSDAVLEVLALQRSDGDWGVGVYDADGWESTTDALCVLRELGADPEDERVRRAVDLVEEHVRWEPQNGGRSFFEGETEACVNGRVAALGGYFGRPSRALVDRLLGQQLADGGWNCDAPASSRSSFHSTVCVLEGLLEFEHAVGDDSAVSAARFRGEEYLLERSLFRRRSTGAVVDETWAVTHVPAYWRYDVLRGLDHFRSASATPDPRLDDAIAMLEHARRPDGTWTASAYEGQPLIDLDASGESSRVATRTALRVLRWAGRTA